MPVIGVEGLIRLERWTHFMEVGNFFSIIVIWICSQMYVDYISLGTVFFFIQEVWYDFDS